MRGHNIIFLVRNKKILLICHYLLVGTDIHLHDSKI